MRLPQSKEHHITVSRTARYATLGDGVTSPRQVGFACHGHSQLATRFIRYFGALDDGSRLIVAPEGLSRFYIENTAGEHGRGADVGATWMTREDRLNEIKDYVAYLDALYGEVFARVERSAVSFWVLGFSQGAATASRWAAHGDATIDHLILWGGTLPPDLDMPAFKKRMQKGRLTIVVGNQDQFIPAKLVAEEVERLDAAAIDYEVERFDGAHQLNKDVLAKVVGDGPPASKGRP